MFVRSLFLVMIGICFILATACSPQREEPKSIPVTKDRLPPPTVKK